LIELRAKG